MLQAEIRQARIDHGYSQAELARLAGVPRERVRQLESGGNVTMETFQKIVAQLPHLKTLSLGPVELQTRGANAAQVRDALAAWLEAGRQLLTLLENVPAEPAPEEESLEQRLQRLEARYQRGEGSGARRPSRVRSSSPAMKERPRLDSARIRLLARLRSVMDRIIDDRPVTEAERRRAEELEKERGPELERLRKDR